MSLSVNDGAAGVQAGPSTCRNARCGRSRFRKSARSGRRLTLARRSVVESAALIKPMTAEGICAESARVIVVAAGWRLARRRRSWPSSCSPSSSGAWTGRRSAPAFRTADHALPGRRGGCHHRDLPRCAPGAGAACWRRWRACPSRDLFSATVVGFMTGLLVPRAGEVVRPYLVARRHPIRTSAGFASIILERLVDLVTVLLAVRRSISTCCPRPRAQTQGPLARLSEGRGRAGRARGALAVLVVLLALHRARGAASWRVVRPAARAAARARWRGAGGARGCRSFAEGLAVLQASPAHLLAIFGQSLLRVAQHRPRHPLEQPRLRARPAVPYAVPACSASSPSAWRCPRRARWAGSTSPTCSR